MTDEQQRKADHLALVAAPILAVMLAGVSNKAALEKRLGGSFAEIAVKAAELLQRAAEERVSKP